MKLLTLLIFVALSASAGLKIENGMIAPFKFKKYPLQAFVKDYAIAMDQRITIGERVKKQLDETRIDLTLNKPIAKDKMTNLFLTMLGNYGLTALELPSGIKLMPQRDIRYVANELVEKNQIDPSSDRYVLYMHETRHPLSGLIARNLRPFLSRYGRVINLSDARKLILSETQSNIATLIPIIEKMDTERLYKNHLEAQRKKAAQAPPDESEKLREKLVELELENKILSKKLMKNEEGR